MKFTNSPLVTYKRITNHKTVNRKYDITRITPHCIVGQWTAKQGCDYFATTDRKCSANYVIGKDGSVGLCVEEKDRSWCSSSSDNDNRAITIECASDTQAPYTFTNTCYNKLIELCVDICKRNGKTKLLWLGDKDKTLAYKPAANEMVLTVHRWFANKSCPGDWMYARMGDLAAKVTARLGGATITESEKTPDTDTVKVSIPTFSPYKVKVSIKNLNIRKGPGTNYASNGFCPVGVYTIIEESKGAGASKWGKLKSGAGWISLDYVTKI